MPLKQAIKEGTSETGAVINSAGIILAGTFAVLATLPIQILVHFGLITASFGEKAFWHESILILDLLL